MYRAGDWAPSRRWVAMRQATQVSERNIANCRNGWPKGRRTPFRFGIGIGLDLGVLEEAEAEAEAELEGEEEDEAAAPEAWSAAFCPACSLAIFLLAFLALTAWSTRPDACF